MNQWGNSQQFNEVVDHFDAAYAIAVHENLPEKSDILVKLARNLSVMGEIKLIEAWAKTFDGKEPPIESIREAKMVKSEN